MTLGILGQNIKLIIGIIFNISSLTHCLGYQHQMILWITEDNLGKNISLFAFLKYGDVNVKVFSFVQRNV